MEQVKSRIESNLYYLIAYCLHVLIQLKTKSKKSLLRISRWLKADLWKSAYIWLHRFKNRALP